MTDLDAFSALLNDKAMTPDALTALLNDLANEFRRESNIAAVVELTGLPRERVEKVIR